MEYDDELPDDAVFNLPPNRILHFEMHPIGTADRLAQLEQEVTQLREALETEEGHRKGLEKAYGNLSRAYELLKARGDNA